MPTPASRRPLIVRWLGRAIPARYRDEVVEDLVDEYHRSSHHRARALVTLLWQLARSAVDSRRVRDDGHLLGPHPRPLTGLATDLRQAWRQHARRPAATVSAVLTIALAIGVNAALFSVVEGVLLKPLPIPDVQQVGFVWDVREGADEPMAPGRALDLWHQPQAFQSAALLAHRSMTVTGLGEPEQWNGASVSASFFDVLETPAALGTTFHERDGGRDLIVLSAGFWRARFGGDPGVIGRTLVMNGRTRTIVGVMPAAFYWPIVAPQAAGSAGPSFWVTAPADAVPEGLGREDNPAADRTTGFLRMVVRLRPGVSWPVAREELAHTAAALGHEYPTTDGGKGASLQPLTDLFLGQVRRPLLFLALASGLVVLLACVNVATLLVMRLPSRGRELAVRVALGAGRRTVARQLLIEGAVLAFPGALLGVLLARVGLGTIVALAPSGVGRLDGVGLDGTVLAASAAALLTCTVVMGALPAFVVWRDRAALDLRAAGAALGTRPRVRQTLVAVEVALAVALVTGATLFGESLLRLRHVDVGFDTSHLLTFGVTLTGDRAAYQAKQVAFFEDMLARIRRLPGVRAAGGAVTLPVGGDDFNIPIFAEGQPMPPPGAERHVGFQIVGSGWFETLGMRLVAGREFTADDGHRDAPVAIVNRRLADLLWPGTSALGRRVRADRGSDVPWRTVVGVVSDIHHLGPAHPPRPEIYEPYFQHSLPFLEVAVRTAGDPLAVVLPIRAAVSALDPAEPVADVQTMDTYLEQAYGSERFLATLTLGFGALALALAVLGVYGVAGWSSTQRTPEFGLRMALGATPAGISRLVLQGGLGPVWVGGAAGVALAAAASRSVQSLLFDTTPVDPIGYGSAAAVVVLTALVACLVPALRAARVDPVSALRAE